MKLSDFNVYDDILVQCHDNPDADAISSAFGVYSYLKDRGKKVRLIYSGGRKITKSNLREMIMELNIPIEYVSPDSYANSDDSIPQLLITCDCQYGEGNVTKLSAENIAVIDHHQVSGSLPQMSLVMPTVGSCATVVWKLLTDEGFDIDENLSTALYYGLFTDTNSLAEVSHPLDRDMIDALVIDSSLIKRFCNMNITLSEAKIAGVAMLGVEYHEKHHYALIESQPCDPNILGLISDFFLSVDTIDACLVFAILDYGIKLSVRSCSLSVQANELAAYLTKNIGNGGGHIDKAGGFIKSELLGEKIEGYNDADPEQQRYMVTAELRRRLHNYFEDTEVIHAGETEIDRTGMERYVKLPLRQGYCIPSEFVPVGTPILVRSLEGDTNVNVTADTVIMIGIRGEIYASRLEVFEKNYERDDAPYDMKLEYTPTVKNLKTGETIDISEKAHSCISSGGNIIIAKPVERTTKVFTKWSPKEYLKGEPGDFLAAKESDPNDAYIINRDIFFETYKKLGD